MRIPRSLSDRWYHRDLAGFWGHDFYPSEKFIFLLEILANVLSSKASAILNRIKVLAGYSRFCAHAVGAFAGAETCLWLVERVGRLAKGKLKISFKCSCARSEKVLSPWGGWAKLKARYGVPFILREPRLDGIEPSGHSRQHELECFGWFKYYLPYLSKATWFATL